jgi:hypothetical protein
MRQIKAHLTLFGAVIGVIAYELYHRKTHP